LAKHQTGRDREIQKFLSGRIESLRMEVAHLKACKYEGAREEREEMERVLRKFETAEAERKQGIYGKCLTCGDEISLGLLLRDFTRQRCERHDRKK